MKKITVRVITISSQLLIVMLFLIISFKGEGSNSEYITIGNNNFQKMADMTSSLFKREEMMITQFDESTLVILDDNRVEDILEEKNECNIINQDADMTSISDMKPEDQDVSLDSVIDTYTGILTGYGPDCVGCGNYNTGMVSTASGYHVSNIVDGAIEPAFTITYNDSEYGEVRIVAADANIPFYSIVRITVPGWENSIIAIVLDRGSTVGFDNCRSDRGCLTNFDLLYPTEAESLGKTQNVKFEILRSGM